MPDELDSLLTFVLDLLRDYGLDDFYLELSTRDPIKYVGTDEDWERATETLRQAAERQDLELVLDPGGAAFYGPKISVQARDAIGRTWQMSTIQVDFNLPQRFELEYTAADGSRQRPVMIHRALFGSIERFFAVLLEHYAGAFPAWLAPVQVVGIPITDGHIDYLDGIAQRLRDALGSVDDERVRQEIAVFATKIDIDEELSRLIAHVEEVERVLTKGGAAGKRLDFLMQELNREANTLGSKSVDAEVSRIAMEMKILIEQMREQIQNLE